MSVLDFKMFNTPVIRKKIINLTVFRQYLAIIFLFFLISCSPDSKLQNQAKTIPVNKYYGGVAADEPHAALEGQMILSLGGTAADAIVAMAFTMMVTRPDAAGPGGGGICIYYDRKSNSAEALDFLPRIPEKNRSSKNGSTIPGSFRGLFSLSSRFGRLRWEQLVGPAERLAKFGLPLSTFQQHVFRQFPFSLSLKRLSEKKSAKTNKQISTNNETVRQHHFAEVLASIRLEGPRVFYKGPLARVYIEGIRKNGGKLNLDDLVEYKPTWKQTAKIQIHDKVLHFISFFSNEGQNAEEIWKELRNKNHSNLSNEKSKELIFIQRTRPFFKRIYKKKFEKGASTGLIAMDAFGNSASCVMTMNKPFGTGKFVGKTGIIPAAADYSKLNLIGSPIVMSNKKFRQGVLAASSVNENVPGLNLVLILNAVLRGKISLEQAVNEPRITFGRKTNEILFETNISKKLKIMLENENFHLIPVKKIGKINVMYCKTGIIVDPLNCSVLADPRHIGYALNSES